MIKRRNQKGFASILALIVVIGFIGYFSYKSLVQEGDNPQTQGYRDQLNKAEEIARIATKRVGEINKELGVYLDEEQNKINVSLKISAKENEDKYSERVENEVSVFDLMKFVDDNNNNFSFKYKDSSLGVFIEEINGIKNSTSDNLYWMYYVNNELSKVSASAHKLTEGDTVDWRYEDEPDLW